MIFFFFFWKGSWKLDNFILADRNKLFRNSDPALAGCPIESPQRNEWVEPPPLPACTETRARGYRSAEVKKEMRSGRESGWMPSRTKDPTGRALSSIRIPTPRIRLCFLLDSFCSSFCSSFSSSSSSWFSIFSIFSSCVSFVIRLWSRSVGISATATRQSSSGFSRIVCLFALFLFACLLLPHPARFSAAV